VTVGVPLLCLVATIAWWGGVGWDGPSVDLAVDARVLHGEPWLLLTGIFPHGDVIHLAFNLYWWFHFATQLERHFGSTRLVLLTVLLGGFSSAVQLTFGVSSIGLSGVGYGLVGFWWARARIDPIWRVVLDRDTTRLFVVWFFFCLVSTWLELWPIGNAAHASGALMGVLVGFATATASRSTRAGGRRAIAASLIVTSGLVAAVGLSSFRHVISSGEGAGLCYLGTAALDAPADNTRAAALLEDAARYRNVTPSCRFNLWIAYDRLGRADEAEAIRKALPDGPLKSQLDAWTAQ
jgi:membrane associated rhomboid family serine protease